MFPAVGTMPGTIMAESLLLVLVWDRDRRDATPVSIFFRSYIYICFSFFFSFFSTVTKESISLVINLI